jgi:glycosyltransferase involved in cell wall biosynthesis
MPLVSVGLPTFNRAATLERAIASVLAQDYPDLELVISDNASTDGTAALCGKFAQSDGRVRYFAQPENRGATANFVEVLRRARGELFMWLGDDDRLDPSYVRLCAAALRADPALSLVAGSAKYYRRGAFLRAGIPMELLYDRPAARILRYYASVGDNGTFYGVMPRALASRVAWRNCLGGDWLFIAAMAYLGKVKTLPQTALHREVGGASASRARLAAVLDLPTVQLALPYSSIAFNAALDVAVRNPVYRDRAALRRGAMACAVFMQLVVSKVVVMNFKIVVVKLLRALMGDERYRRLRERIR